MIFSNERYVVGLDWLQLYCYNHATSVGFKSVGHWRVADNDYPTKQYARRAVFSIFENGSPFQYAELLYFPRVSSINPRSCQLRILNAALYRQDWYYWLCSLFSSFPLEYRSISRIDVYADFNRFAFHLHPKALIHGFVNRNILKIGVQRGYINFDNMGYQVASNDNSNSDVNFADMPNYNAITFGSKGYVQTQIYCKSKELRDVKYKDWIYQTWVAAGLDTNDVWRLEFRIQKGGKDLILLDSSDMFCVGISEICSSARIMDLFFSYCDRYARFVYRDGHVKRQQMRKVVLFSENPDFDPCFKLKSRKTKAGSRRGVVQCLNYLNALEESIEKGEIELQGYHHQGAIMQVRNVLNQLFPAYDFTALKTNKPHAFIKLENDLLRKRGVAPFGFYPKIVVTNRTHDDLLHNSSEEHVFCS